MRWSSLARNTLPLMLACAMACTPAKQPGDPPAQAKETGVVSGIVVDERGDPVADATVTLNVTGPFVGIRPADQSDRTGKFWFGRLPWGKYIICARKESDGYRETCDSVFTTDGGSTATISAQAPAADLRVTIGPRAGTLSGTIRDALTGKPVNPLADAVSGTHEQAVLLIRPAGEKGRPFYQPVDPQFTVLIPPDADLELEIRARGYELWRFSVDGQRGRPFRIKSGEERKLAVRLRPLFSDASR